MKKKSFLKFPPGDEEPAVDLDVEEDESREWQEPQQDGPRVHVLKRHSLSPTLRTNKLECFSMPV